MFDLNKFTKLNKNFITLCDDKEVLKTLSHQEVIDTSEILKNTLGKIVNEENICFGLLMNHNVYIPSIIISLRKLNHAFVFLSSTNFQKIVTYVKSLWILSFEDVKELPLFKEVGRLKLDDKTLIVWSRGNPFPTTLNFQNIFCVVQTSGSTGENKLIRVTDTCIQTNASNLRQIFDINSGDIIFWGTNLTFDPSIIELTLALQTGASLLIVPRRVSINPKKLYDALFNVANVTLLQMVPSVFLRWNDDEIKQIFLNPHLKILAFGGEHFPKRILCHERSSNLRTFNLYGISEVSCWATLHEIKDEGYSDEIPIGKSLEATVIEIRDEFGKVINQGKGEIFIGSSSRICYINEEVPEQLSGTVFRETGDIGEAKENGIFLVGRKNRIIKRFGHRINLTKLEKRIFEETGLESVCIWSHGNGKLLTFVIMKTFDVEIKGKVLDKLRIKLMNILSNESFPDFIDIVSNLPLTSHGKINERALENLYSSSQITASCEETFRLLWCKYLGISIESLNELKEYKFFDIGGNSITALQLLTELKETVTYEFPEELVSLIFEGTFEDCMRFLKSCKPLKKKIINTPMESIKSTVKRKKITDNALKILWSYDLKACVDCSPLIFQKGDITYIAVGSFSQKFVVFKEDGEVVYERTFPGCIEGTPSISPCKHFLLVGCFDGVMYCIDFVKKEMAWEFTTGGQIKSSACFCPRQSAAIFGSYDKTIYSVSLVGGSKIWNTSLDGSISSNPLYSELKNSVFCATTKGTCFCLNGDDGRVLWKYNCSGPIFGTPCLANSNESIIFPTVQGILHCLQAISGNLLWNYDVNGYIFSSLVSHKNQILFGCDKNVVLINISVSGCELVKTAMMESKITTPFVSDLNKNCVIIAACNSGVINVMDFNTFELISSIQLPGEVFSSPVVYIGRIYLGCRDNNFYCIELNK